jgi:hypothetical protein
MNKFNEGDLVIVVGPTLKGKKYGIGEIAEIVYVNLELNETLSTYLIKLSDGDLAGWYDDKAFELIYTV